MLLSLSFSLTPFLFFFCSCTLLFFLSLSLSFSLTPSLFLFLIPVLVLSLFYLVLVFSFPCLFLLLTACPLDNHVTFLSLFFNRSNLVLMLYCTRVLSMNLDTVLCSIVTGGFAILGITYSLSCLRVHFSLCSSLAFTCPLSVLQIVTVFALVFRMSFFLYFLCIKTTNYSFLRYSINFEAPNMIVSFFAFLCPQSKALLSHIQIHSYKPMLTLLFIDFHHLLHIQSLLLVI